MLDIPSPIARINDIREGRVLFDTSMARHVLEHMNYPRQRRIEKMHVDALAQMMRSKIMLSGSQIAFGKFEGQLFLVNGQHRMSAVVDCGLAQEFQVLVVPCATERDLKELYWRFDAMVRDRSTEQLLNAAGIHEEHSLSKGLTKAVFHAVGFILNDMKQPIGSHAMNAVERRVLDFRLEACRPYWSHARAYEKALGRASGVLRRKMLGGGVVAVALVTYKYQPDLAEKFWSRTAANDGLRKGDPCHALVEVLRDASPKGCGNLHVGQCISAWNAFMVHRTVTMLRPPQSIHLKGTPIGSDRVGE